MDIYNRRAFLRHSVMLAASVAASRVFIPPVSGLAAFNPLSVRPLEMLALGDSVMWGQGLQEDQKFYTLVRRWLEGALQGRAVNQVKVNAHSGATILPEEGGIKPCNREVNMPRPTIYSQITDAAREYRAAGTDLSAIDLVLIDGGINDMSPFTLVKPFVLKKHIKEAADEYCYVEMKKLLKKVVSTYCNARVVVTGYFPIISTDTPPEMLMELILLGFGSDELRRVGIKGFHLVRKLILLGKDKDEAGPILKHAAEVSDLWYRESTLALQRAVGEVNAELNANPQSAPCNQSPAIPGAPPNPLNRRVIFAHVNFKKENCYGAADETTYLWKLVDADRPFNPFDHPIERLKSNDTLFEDRAKWCKCEEAKKQGLKLRICQRAGTAHPNERGAKEYARAITEALTPVLPFTGWAQGSPVALVASSYVANHYVSNRQAAEPQGFDRPFFTSAKNRPEVIAHRGGAGHWPGETMYAFERAVKMGVDVLELDIHMTSDGHLVLMHNDTVDETTNGSGEIKKKTWDYLQTLDAGYRWKHNGDFPYRGLGIKIPELEEVFKAFSNMRMNIEIKQSEPSLILKFCDMIKKHNMKDKLLVASFSDDVMNEFRRQCPGVATSTATLELAEFLLKNRLTGGKFKPQHADVIQMKDRLGLLQLMQNGFVERVHNLRLPVHAWTVNEPEDMRKMIAAGVDGIITDYPETLLKLLGRLQ